jgi:hypothetical protein
MIMRTVCVLLRCVFLLLQYLIHAVCVCLLLQYRCVFITAGT